MPFFRAVGQYSPPPSPFLLALVHAPGAVLTSLRPSLQTLPPRCMCHALRRLGALLSALVVQSHHTMSTVKAVTSPRIILGFLAISVLATVAVVPFWETMTISGTLLWSINTDEVSSEPAG